MAKLDENLRYRVAGYGGVAWRYNGPETRTGWDEDFEEELRYETGMVEMVMVGDDRIFIIDPQDVEPISDDAYCSECGQIGCEGDFRNA